jgi:hypothetical protein
LVTLSWSVTGATTLTLDNGLGDVTGRAYVAIGLTRTATIKLTATNAGGSVSKTVTITIPGSTPTPTPTPQPPAGDTTPPSAPSITSAGAVSATRIDIRWSASSDNVGVQRYSLLRNNAVLANLSPSTLTYSDTAVSPGATYTYRVIAYDAANNASPGSATVSVTTPASPSPTPAPTPPPPPSGGSCAAGSGVFTGCYYNNLSFSGTPYTRTDQYIQFNWGGGAPIAGLAARNYTVRWQGRFNFSGGTYQFNALTAGGVRIFVDGSPVIDKWEDREARYFNIAIPVSAGSHVITVEYMETTGQSMANVSWFQR